MEETFSVLLFVLLFAEIYPRRNKRSIIVSDLSMCRHGEIIAEEADQ
jgi:hypothetical protein